MAESSPASTHSCRNTELSTWRAAGFRPKETLESPRMVETPGSSALIGRMPSMVSMPSCRLSSMPVESGQREGVEEQVLGREPVALDRDVADVAGRPQLPLRRSGLALLVDAGAHDRGAELAGQAEEGVEPGAGLVALLEVDRVEDGPAADPLQRGPHDGPLGRVDHERHAGLGAEAAGHLGHVRHAVGARVVDADVDEVGALLHLVAGHGDAGVPVALQHRLPEGLGPVGVGALADDEERGVLAEGDGGVDGGRSRLVHGRARRRERRRRSVPRRRPGGPGSSRSIRPRRRRRTR